MGQIERKKQPGEGKDQHNMGREERVGRMTGALVLGRFGKGGVGSYAVKC